MSIKSQATIIVTELDDGGLHIQSFGNGEAEKFTDDIVRLIKVVVKNPIPEPKESTPED